MDNWKKIMMTQAVKKWHLFNLQEYNLNETRICTKQSSDVSLHSHSQPSKNLNRVT